MSQSKKSWQAVLGGCCLASAFALFGVEETWSYATTAGDQIRQEVRDRLPTEFHLQRLRDLSRSLQPSIDAIRLQVAKLKTDQERTSERLAAKRSAVERDGRAMSELRKALDESGDELRLGSRMYRREQVERELSQRLDRREFALAEIAAQEKLQATLEKTLAARVQRLIELEHERKMIDSKISLLDSQRQLVSAQEAEHSGRDADRRITSEADQLATEVESRLKVMLYLSDDPASNGERIALESDSGVTARYDAAFGRRR